MLQTAFPSSATTARDDLLAVAVALGARRVPDWSDAETDLVSELPDPLPLFFQATRDAIRRGEDPLGDGFCRIYSAEERRPRGATYTPQPIIDAMLSWAKSQVRPVRIVDPGAGSARFLVSAGRLFPDAELIAIELDPVSAILGRGHLAAAGLADRSRVIVGDYRSVALPRVAGPTLYLGNPPYVRHHLIAPHWKVWLRETARRFGVEASQLAGLHAHFFLATAEHARSGDIGVLITAAEWLDVNYGRLVRELLTGILGAMSIHVIEPSASPFPGTQTTAVITGFEVGSEPDSVGMRRVAKLEELRTLEADWRVGRERLKSADRWTPLTRPSAERREGFIELGELCRVHRGQVTGANRVWITDNNEYGLPENVLFRSVTRARELIAAKDVLSDPLGLRHVIDLPLDWRSLYEMPERRRIEKFLRFAKAQGADSGFVARHRKAWWSVGLRDPAPILATYMARRPPAFVRNQADVRHINIAHGLYPREKLTEPQLRTLATYLSQSVRVEEGRTYAGGLTKFEPREMERLLVPRPELLADHAYLDTLP